MIETYTMYKVTKKGFRLVHDDNNVLSLIEGTDNNQTMTIHRVEEFATEKEAMIRIKVLGLKYEPEAVVAEKVK